MYKRFSDAGCRDITLGFYRYARHELFNETNREEVREDLLSGFWGIWRNRVVNGPGL